SWPSSDPAERRELCERPSRAGGYTTIRQVRETCCCTSSDADDGEFNYGNGNSDTKFRIAISKVNVIVGKATDLTYEGTQNERQGSAPQPRLCVRFRCQDLGEQRTRYSEEDDNPDGNEHRPLAD